MGERLMNINTIITRDTLQQHIEQAVSTLLNMARECTWNTITDHCLFIVSEIKNSTVNFFEERRLDKNEKEKIVPLSLQQVMPFLLELYSNLHDINLYIYQATQIVTVIDIQYYLKSSPDSDYAKKIAGNPPMLHCKIAIPPWLQDKNEKFDINWPLNEG